MKKLKTLRIVGALLIAGILLAYKPDVTVNKPFANITEIETDGTVNLVYKVGNYILYIVNDSSIYILDSNYKHVYEAEQRLNPIPDRINITHQYNHNLFFLLENNTLFIIDSNLQQNIYAEEKLNKVPVNILFKDVDSLYIYDHKDVYTILPDFEMRKTDTATFFKRHRLGVKLNHGSFMTDSIYYIYSCGLSEFGGNVFFQNKKTGKTYSMPVYLKDITLFGGTYHVTEGYFDIAFSEYIAIKDPITLFENNPNSNSFCCNCDEAYGQAYYTRGRITWRKKHHAITYYETSRFATLKTFIRNDSLYSIGYNDSMYYLVTRGDTALVVDSIKNGKQNIDIDVHHYINLKNSGIDILRFKRKV